VCGLFEWKRIYAGFSLLFVYICIAVGDPNQKCGGIKPVYEIPTLPILII
jgi:hypothetical protein